MAEQREQQPHGDRIVFFDKETDKLKFRDKKDKFIGPDKKTPLGNMHLEGFRLPDEKYYSSKHGLYLMGPRTRVAPAQKLYDHGLYEIELTGPTIPYSYSRQIWEASFQLPGELDPFKTIIKYNGDTEQYSNVKGASSSFWT